MLLTAEIDDNSVSRRRLLGGLVLLVAVGISGSLGCSSVMAKDGDDDGSSHGGRSEDNSSGSGSDVDNDVAEPGGSNRDDSDDDNGGSGDDIGDIRLRLEYTDGFGEEVAGGTYLLTDAKGRIVVRRPAVAEDVRRIQQLLK